MVFWTEGNVHAGKYKAKMDVSLSEPLPYSETYTATYIHTVDYSELCLYQITDASLTK